MGKFLGGEVPKSDGGAQAALDAQQARVAEEKRKLDEESKRERDARRRRLRGRQSLFSSTALGFAGEGKTLGG